MTERNGLDKVVASAEAAVADVPDGATVLVGGFAQSIECLRQSR